LPWFRRRKNVAAADAAASPVEVQPDPAVIAPAAPEDGAAATTDPTKPKRRRGSRGGRGRKKTSSASGAAPATEADEKPAASKSEPGHQPRTDVDINESGSLFDL